MLTIALDLETTNDGPDGCPEAHWQANDVILCGYSVDGNDVIVEKSTDNLVELIQGECYRGNQVLLVGHNIKFDLKYLYRDKQFQNIIDIYSEYLHVTCTMTGHYRISGHHVKFPSLEETANEFGVKFTKSLDLDDLIKNGVKMRDIPLADLEPYLRSDVEAVSEIYKQMHPHLKQLDHDYILQLVEMEMEGLPIDKDKCQQMANEAWTTLESCENFGRAYCKKVLEWSNGDPIETNDFERKSQALKPFAPRTLSYLLTGEPSTGICKRGNKYVRFKQGMIPIMSHAEVSKVWNLKPTHLGYPLPEDKVAAVGDVLRGRNSAIVNNLLDFRAANKLYNTYLCPFLEVIKHPKWHGQDTIHPKYNTAQTATGRLSSSNPNGQNIPPEAKKVICASIPSHELYELDFKQLEIVALAAVSQCPDLIRVLNSGADIHYETGRKVYGWSDPSEQTEELRRLVKGVNFGLLYGGGPATISKQTGAPKKLVKQLIEAFYDSFPGVAKWQRQFFEEVCGAMVQDHYDKNGEVVYKSTVYLPDDFGGRCFTFVEKESPKWLKTKFGRSYSFKPTETKNYPIQGFAGGDITMAALHLLKREAYKMDMYFRATVHDSILVETGRGLGYVKALAEWVALEVGAMYNLPCDLKLEVEHGYYWKEDK